MVARPSAAEQGLGRAMFRAGLSLSRQGPCALDAVCAASRPCRPAATQFRKPGPAAPPLLPGDGTQPPPDPLFEPAQDRRGLAVAEVAAPTDQIARSSSSIC